VEGVADAVALFVATRHLVAEGLEGLPLVAGQLLQGFAALGGLVVALAQGGQALGELGVLFGERAAFGQRVFEARFVLGDALFEVFAGGLGTGVAGAGAAELIALGVVIAAHLFEARAGLFGAVFGFFALGGGALGVVLERVQSRVQDGAFFLQGAALLFGAVFVLVVLRLFAANARQGVGVMAVLAFEHGDGAVGFEGVALGGFEGGARLGFGEAERRGVGVEGFDGGVGVMGLRLGIAELGRHGFLRGEDFEVAVGGDVEFGVHLLGGVLFVALGLARLFAQAGEVAVHFADDVGNAQQVLLGELHFAQGGGAGLFEARDAGGFFEHGAAVFGAGTDDEADAALLDDGVGSGAPTGAQEEVGDVFEAARGFVDEVLAGAVAVQAPRDGDLGVVDVERVGEAVGVVEGDGDLGQGLGAAFFGAVEDDVVHAAAAEVFGGLFAQAPADGVNDVALAAAVGAHHSGERVVEQHLGVVAKGFESRECQAFDSHKNDLECQVGHRNAVVKQGRRATTGAAMATYCISTALHIYHYIYGGRQVWYTIYGNPPPKKALFHSPTAGDVCDVFFAPCG
jgi:hypothetical protein